MATNQETDKFNDIMVEVEKESNMPSEDRRRVVLAFMAKNDLALKPATIYRNLRLHNNITFTRETVKNILHEFVEDGYIRRVDPKSLEDRELVDVKRGEGRGAYIITEQGKEKAAQYINSQ